MTESVTIEATTPLVQTSSSELGTTVDEEQIKTLPLNGRNFVVAHANRSRRAARHPWRQHRWRRQPRVARVRVVLGQRSARARQQLHARRRRQQRDLAADRRHLPERRCARRVQAADEHLLGRVRPLDRRRRQPADQVGHEQVARQRLRVPPQRRVRRQQLLQQPRRPRQARLQAEPVRRDARRPDLQGQDVLLRRLPGPPRGAGPDVPLDRAVDARCARETSPS